jgi:hypothetical protein
MVFRVVEIKVNLIEEAVSPINRISDFHLSNKAKRYVAQV